MDSILTAKGLTKKYSKFTLGELDFEIPKGFATALIGANGAGKTTLIDALCGVIPKSGGKVTYFGQYDDVDLSAVREKIGYCASSAFFPQGWTSRDIAASMELAFTGFDREKFRALCEELDVDSDISKKPKPMYKQSDGNRMRISLAAVFARQTDLLVLDEPGSSLDPLMRDRLCDRLRGYLEEGGGEKSILFSTHNIADMENAADYAIFMDKGRIIECGFVEELKEKYMIAHGAAEDYEKAQHLLMSHSLNRTVFDGLILAENAEPLAALGVDSEAPTLQQLSIGLLKYAEEMR